jgi:copper homeostasis protein CutC
MFHVRSNSIKILVELRVTRMLTSGGGCHEPLTKLEQLELEKAPHK